MENKETTQTSEKVATPKKAKKKECTAGQGTNLAFASITLFVLCAVFIVMGIYFLAGMKAYLGGVMLLIFGVAFAVLNVVLNKSTLFKKAPAKTEEKNEEK